MENSGLIKKIAWTFARTTGLPLNDLIQEASLAYLKSEETYNPAKGARTTHAWYCITNHLKNYLKTEKKHLYGACSFNEDLESFDSNVNSKSYKDSLTEDALKIAEVVLASPGCYTAAPRESVITRLKTVMEQQGWPRSKTMSAIHTLQIVYS